MNFEPVNNYLYVKVIEKEEEKTGVLVPEGYKVAKSPYQVVEIIRSSALNTYWMPETKVVVEASMLCNFQHGDDNFFFIKENYVVGMLTEELEFYS